MENTTQNKAGATYLVQGSFGEIQNKNLFRAYAEAAQAAMTTGSCEINLRATGSVHNISDRAVTVWYIPEAAAYDRIGLAGLPLNKAGELCGTPIYADTTNTAINQHIKRKISK